MPFRFRCPTCRTLLGISERMLGEITVCPRCSQRIQLPPTQTILPAAPGSGPPPIPQKTIYPELPTVLEPPGLDILIAQGQIVSERDLRPRGPKPKKVWWLELSLVLGGLYAIAQAIAMAVVSQGICCCWPGQFVEIPFAIYAIIKGVMLLLSKHQPKPPEWLVIAQALMGLNFDLVNTALGAINIFILCCPGTRQYYQAEY